MKKIITALCILFAFTLNATPPGTDTVDDSERGTGINQHSYIGAGWIFGSSTPTFINSTLSASKTTGAYMIFTFESNKIEWYTEKKNTHGIVAISIDGGPEIMIDLYSSTEQHAVVYTSPTLPSIGVPHTFKMRVTGTKNPASSNYYGIHDAFIVHYGATESVTNTAFGEVSMQEVYSGQNNSAFGYNALANVISSYDNTAIGSGALPTVYRGNSNTAIGANSMASGSGDNGGNTAIGAHAMQSGSGVGNITIGALSDVTDFSWNSMAIGYGVKTTADNQVRIGNSEVTSIGGQVSWSTLSDGRFKRDVRKDVSGLEFINELQPVSYTVDNSALRQFLGVSDSLMDSKSVREVKPLRQTGFVAQEVDKLVKKSGYVFNGVDVPQNDKDPYSIRYAEFVVPLVKAVQELSALVEQQQQQLNQLMEKREAEKANPAKSSEIQLYQNNPNPFTANTEIKMVLPETVASARVIVYNLEGKQLKELNVKERGDASVTITSNELGAGMYIYALIADGKVVATKRMILTK